jgi:hypothetical protein
VQGTSRCPRCGSAVPVGELLAGVHECDIAQRARHEASQLDEQAELLHFELEEFLRSTEGRRRLAFARWCRERGRP